MRPECKRRIVLSSLTAAAVLLASLACSSSNTQRVRVPPRVDLTRYATVGIVRFESDSVPDLAERATDAFLARIMAAQPGVAVLELGTLADALRSVGGSSLDARTIRKLADEHGIDALLVGSFEAAEARPNFSINALAESLSARAEIEGTLTARLYVARSGATVWTDTARGKRTLASVDLANRTRPRVGGSSVDEAHSSLVNGLTDVLCAPFQPRWERR